jgi:hypothetical protein
MENSDLDEKKRKAFAAFAQSLSAESRKNRLFSGHASLRNIAYEYLVDVVDYFRYMGPANCTNENRQNVNSSSAKLEKSALEFSKILLDSEFVKVSLLCPLVWKFFAQSKTLMSLFQGAGPRVRVSL